MGALKLISLLGLLTNIKVFCRVFHGIYRNFFYFLFEDTRKYSILTKFQKFLSNYPASVLGVEAGATASGSRNGTELIAKKVHTCSKVLIPVETSLASVIMCYGF